MDEQQPTFKVVDRRPFNPDGTPRELSPEERAENERAAASAAAAVSAEPQITTPQTALPPESPAAREPQPERPRSRPERAHAAGDPLDDPASFLSLIMSLASNAASSLGMMPHPVTGESGVDLKTAKRWIDVLGMLEQKTDGNLDEHEAQMLENLLADLRMQYVSFSGSPTPPAKFSANDITGGK